jgi:AcrR family transcriptional regulator
MSEATLRPRRREQTRARLLEAAHEVFGEVGMDAASVETICERAGFTRGAFYSNFESKDELFLALISQLAEEKLQDVADRVQALGPDAAIDLAGLVHRVVDVSVGQQMEPQLISEIRTQALRDPRLATAFLAWQDAMRRRVEDIIVRVVEAYGLRLRLPVEEAAQLLLDVADDTCTRATLEGRGEREIGALLNRRIESLVGVLVDA